VTNTLGSFRNGAVGFLDWLDVTLELRARPWRRARVRSRPADLNCSLRIADFGLVELRVPPRSIDIHSESHAPRHRRSEEVREYLRGDEETPSCSGHVAEPAH